MKSMVVFVLFVQIYGQIFAQTIQGIVRDSSGRPLADVSVEEANESNFTYTDSNGYFKLSVDTVSFTLKFSHIGYYPYEATYDLRKDTNFVVVTLVTRSYRSKEVVISATKIPEKTDEVPGDVNLLSFKEVNALPYYNIDEMLNIFPGVFVYRPFGIFGKSIVNIRGITSDEPGRQLTLIDGIPVNKSEGGSTNWNRLIPVDIDHVEILKGPNSSILGNNALSGAVYVFTKHPESDSLKVKIKASYGTYNTKNGEFSIMQSMDTSKSGFYYALAGKALYSDGCFFVPDSLKSDYDTSFFVKDNAVNIRAGYKTKDSQSVEAEYDYCKNYRGQGTKIKLPEGSTVTYDTHFARMKYEKENKNMTLSANVYYQLELYDKKIEKLKKNEYTLIDVDSDRKDYGMVTDFTYKCGNHVFLIGGDIRRGRVYGTDIYKTSTDKVINAGSMSNGNLYFEDVFSFKKFKLIPSLNFAFSAFEGGKFQILFPTQATSYMLEDTGKLEKKIWKNVSPDLAMQYFINRKTNVYVKFSKGFRTATLDDMTRSGFINIGYKVANPDLLPETLTMYESGGHYHNRTISVSFNGFYSKGNNFMYYVFTGETLFGGRKKIYRKENVSKVEIYGASSEVVYRVVDDFKLILNYSHTYSEIIRFSERPELEEKSFAFSPFNVFNFSTVITKRKLTIFTTLKYQDKFFLDEENKLPVKNIFLTDFKIALRITKNIKIACNILNAFDYKYMVNSYETSLGRFVNFEILGEI